MELHFATVHDVTTNKSMLVRVDLIQKVYESEINNTPCRVIQFINGDIEYVHNSLEVLSETFKHL